MAYLIDGNNFIGHTIPYGLKDPRSKYSLVSKLLIFHHIKRTKVSVVFDGAPDAYLEEKEFQQKSFSVIYPSFGQNADMVITEIILKQKDLKKFFVVSSDREIKSFARMKGAKVLTCKEFNLQLKTILKEYKKSQETEKKDTLLSPLEVNHWLEMFKKND